MQHIAVRNRMLVPLFSSQSSVVLATAGSPRPPGEGLGVRVFTPNLPPHPVSEIVFAAKSCPIGSPNRRRLSIITCVSTLSRTPANVVGPSASAARTSARLVRLFDPGGRMEPITGRETGWISRVWDMD